MNYARARQLRCMSWNIKHAAGRLDQLGAISRVITNVNPDVMLLQEVDCRTHRSGGIDQAEHLAIHTKMTRIYSPTMRYDGGFYGNAILVRGNWNRLTTLLVNPIERPSEPRGVMAIGGPSLPGVATTHLSRNPTGAAKFELAELLSRLPEWIDVIIGDFNHSYGNKLPAPWTEVMESSSGHMTPTYPSSEPKEVIDRAIVRNTRHRAKKSVLSVPLSDHLPILVELST